MGYTKVGWKDEVTPLNAANLEHMEDGIIGAYTLAEDISKAVSADTLEEFKQDVQNTVTELSNKISKGSLTFDSANGRLRFDQTSST